MEYVLVLVSTYGLWVVFLAVLLDQGGLPIPSFGVVAVVSAFHAEHTGTLLEILALGVLAGFIADVVWYLTGRRYAGRLLSMICRISLSPDSCVSTTKSAYAKNGPGALLAAKFLPGAAAIATAMAGEDRMHPGRFLLWDGLACLIWSGAAVALGVTFSGAVKEVLDALAALGTVGGGLALAIVGVYIGRKWWQRRAFIREIQMARISPEELKALSEGDPPPLVLDVRPRKQRETDGWIPGALGVDDPKALDLPRDREIVVYCACPNEASAAVLAKSLLERGAKKVRPLLGGIEAWRAKGFDVQQLD